MSIDEVALPLALTALTLCVQLLTEPTPAQVVVVYCAEGNKWEERFYGGVVEGVVDLWPLPQSYLVRVKILLPTQVSI